MDLGAKHASTNFGCCCWLASYLSKAPHLLSGEAPSRADTTDEKIHRGCMGTSRPRAARCIACSKASKPRRESRTIRRKEHSRWKGRRSLGNDIGSHVRCSVACEVSEDADLTSEPSCRQLACCFGPKHRRAVTLLAAQHARRGQESEVQKSRI